ncbi:probable 39S ribosomal protein L45, mitochondrial [Daktulosphaira vitifoliae]|uniref:probable 39S ribosomal protein L45, mitochondrial n=1 Tax=Daktulosphaira vitifoliae TaxID=58002 RepID=UPI0021A97DFD|nr:probable 39S ribosomal protein L45, mitochondrial [Daktulosphaira vitifoliae]
MFRNLYMVCKRHNILSYQTGHNITKSIPIFYNVGQSRKRSNKHYKPEFKKLRSQKVIKVELPDYEKDKLDDDNYSPEYLRTKFKEKGVQPVRQWIERSTFINNTGQIIEPYVPPEGDGKISPISTAGAKQKLEFLKKKKETWQALRKIRQNEEEFELYPEFINLAQDIYIKAHKTMAEKDKKKLLQYVTEKAYVEMIHNIDGKTLRWSFIKSIEPPRVVHARVTDIITQDNLFAQLTVRFHSQQTLSVFDRFGRLIFGSDVIVKNVLEYVVYEKHIVNQYGLWRIHGKIIPDWMPPREPVNITYPLIQEDTNLIQTALDSQPDEGKSKIVLPDA